MCNSTKMRERNAKTLDDPRVIEIENLDHLFEKRDKPQNRHFLAPKNFFRMLVSAPSNSGKTNMVANMILKTITWERIFIFAKDLDDEMWIALRKEFKDMQEIIDETDNPFQLATFSDKMDDIPNIKDLKRGVHKLFIFDDFVTDKNQSKISEMFRISRHKDCSCIYLSQSFFDTPKFVRHNCDYVALFRPSENNKQTQIAKTLGMRVGTKRFTKIFKEATRNPFNFLLVDKNALNLCEHLRCGFDQLLSIDPDDIEVK